EACPAQHGANEPRSRMIRPTRNNEEPTNKEQSMEAVPLDEAIPMSPPSPVSPLTMAGRTGDALDESSPGPRRTIRGVVSRRYPPLLRRHSEQGTFLMA